MGYARYDTPLGPAGYAVTDTCHHDGCDMEIDRGLGHLCGDEPGCETEDSCGRWFCGGHLFYGPRGQRCEPCLDGCDEPEDTGGTPSESAEISRKTISSKGA